MMHFYSGSPMHILSGVDSQSLVFLDFKTRNVGGNVPHQVWRLVLRG